MYFIETHCLLCFVDVTTSRSKEPEVVVFKNSYFINPYYKMVYLDSSVDKHDGGMIKLRGFIHVIVDYEESIIRFKVDDEYISTGYIYVAELREVDLYASVYVEKCQNIKVNFAH